ncbi:MAG: hypothetical protein JZU72_01865 [Chlorobium phaeobacteroides]|jgi:hypothetical protein|nr:hypothetical protein [Chlorobium phaeobacteroides]
MNHRITTSSLNQLLGIPRDTPLHLDEMCKRLRPVLYPAPAISDRLERFCQALSASMATLGIELTTPEKGSLPNGRFRPGTVILAPGEFPDNLLAINRVSTLYNNIIVGIYDEPAPLTPEATAQERLDIIVRRLARDMVHMLIFVTDHSWTLCTMNGGVVTLKGPCPDKNDVRCTLVPKLTAQVVPPKPEDLDILHPAKQDEPMASDAMAEDFLLCSALWSNSSYLLTHTSRENLPYRNDYYKKIVARYLDERNGMSYGFFARQLPVKTEAAIKQEPGPAGANNNNAKKTMLPVRVLNQTYLVPIPAVTILTTRSGCRKNNLNTKTDLVEITLNNGRISMKTAGMLPEGTTAKPSFDTLTIAAHALGNALVASILKTAKPESSFPRYLERHGASMTHWHGVARKEHIPEGYFLHGENNPPVSCSTPQSAAYSLLGKIEALEQALEAEIDYQGDVHLEPNHGTNIVGTLTLAETARILRQYQNAPNPRTPPLQK